jgi:hypothetical protein
LNNHRIFKFSKVRYEKSLNFKVEKSHSRQKTPNRVLFRIKLWKSRFSKRNWEKIGPFYLPFGFFKRKNTLKAKPNTPLFNSHSDLCQTVWWSQSINCIVSIPHGFSSREVIPVDIWVHVLAIVLFHRYMGLRPSSTWGLIRPIRDSIRVERPGF